MVIFTQALLYNGDCDQASSVIIATDPTSTSFGLKNTVNQLKKVTVDSYKPVCNNLHDYSTLFYIYQELSFTTEFTSSLSIYK